MVGSKVMDEIDGGGRGELELRDRAWAGIGERTIGDGTQASWIGGESEDIFV